MNALHCGHFLVLAASHSKFPMSRASPPTTDSRPPPSPLLLPLLASSPSAFCAAVTCSRTCWAHSPHSLQGQGAWASRDPQVQHQGALWHAKQHASSAGTAAGDGTGGASSASSTPVALPLPVAVLVDCPPRWRRCLASFPRFPREVEVPLLALEARLVIAEGTWSTAAEHALEGQNARQDARSTIEDARTSRHRAYRKGASSL